MSGAPNAIEDAEVYTEGEELINQRLVMDDAVREELIDEALAEVLGRSPNYLARQQGDTCEDVAEVASSSPDESQSQEVLVDQSVLDIMHLYGISDDTSIVDTDVDYMKKECAPIGDDTHSLQDVTLELVEGKHAQPTDRDSPTNDAAAAHPRATVTRQSQG